MIDLHCHILPGIDDGSASMNESILMCEMAEKDGIDTIVATPHRGSFVANTTREQVLTGVRKLSKQLREKGIQVNILPGHEIHITETTLDDIESGEALTINDHKSFALLELPFKSVPFYAFEVIKTLQFKGITPIIAHPERNTQIQSDPDIVSKLIDHGAMTQVTGSSFLGNFGVHSKRTAIKLLKKGLIHLVASDAHSQSRPPVLAEIFNNIVKIEGQSAAIRLMHDNPSKVIENLEFQ